MMHVCFAFLETIGTSELLVIAFVALIVFGPRKLPELARKMGHGLGEFKRASDEFKRTWEHEVEMERLDTGQRASSDATVSRAAGLPAVSVFDATASDAALTASDAMHTTATAGETQTIARHSSHAPDMYADPVTGAHDTTEGKAANTNPPGKEDWL